MPRFTLKLSRAALTSILPLFLAATPTMAKDHKQTIIPPSHKQTYENFQYAPAVRAGDILYLSGVVARLDKGETIDNIAPAMDRAFNEIELILKEAGADWSDVVDVTSYITNFDKLAEPMWAVKVKRVPAPHPAWTAIGVERLFGGDAALIEIKVTAYLPQKEN